MVNELTFKDYIIHNNHLSKSRDVDIKKVVRPSIYELLSVMKGKPLFLEDHVERLLKSTKLKGIQINIDANSIKEQIRVLCEKNEITNGYLKMIFYFDNSQVENALYFFIKHFTPTDRDYSEGVKATYLSAERNMPNIKLSNLNIRALANDIKNNEDVFEVLLVDKNGFVTEGSRSNLFFIKNETVITSPSEKVLEGITRKYIIEICNRNNIKCIERSILQKEIQTMDSVFITGTSSKILPIKSIGHDHFDVSSNLIIRLIDLYDKKMLEYLCK